MLEGNRRSRIETERATTLEKLHPYPISVHFPDELALGDEEGVWVGEIVGGIKSVMKGSIHCSFPLNTWSLVWEGQTKRRICVSLITLAGWFGNTGTFTHHM